MVRGGVMGLSLGPGVSEFPGFHVRHWFQCGVMVTHEVRGGVVACVMVFQGEIHECHRFPMRCMGWFV